MCVMLTRSSSLHEAMPLEKIAAIKAKRLKIKRTKIKGISTVQTTSNCHSLFLNENYVWLLQVSKYFLIFCSVMRQS